MGTVNTAVKRGILPRFAHGVDLTLAIVVRVFFWREEDFSETLKFVQEHKREELTQA